ncbi:MAG: uracil-xanthine permease family protein [Peptoniphilaceae bacterium]|nr:uracil-xanthine permease family protein [Peptoniphilaceae bacterium]MDY5766536.1 uracil-xanthine permease family protein [Peptoniphilaceae bacterium]
MTDQKARTKLGNEPIWDIRKLPIAARGLLGLQHLFAMFGATVLVPLLTGLDISTTLLMAGLGTLLFHLITKGKVPAFLGSSFAFLGGYAAVAPMVDGMANSRMLPYASGGVFFAGLVYVILAAFIKFFGVKKVMRFFPPVVTGPIIVSIGLTLAPSAIANASTNWIVALSAIAIVVYFNIWGKGMMKIIPIILGVLGGYVVALLMHEVDFSSVAAAHIIGSPIKPQNFMKFDISAIISIVPISLATMMEHIGDITAISATVERNYIQDPGLHRTLLGDGLATSMASIVGGPANTTYGENTGVLVLTRVYDPRAMRLAAVFAIILSFFPVVSEVIRSIPMSVIGGVSLILYGMISSVGVRNLVENQIDFTKSRNLIVAAAIFVCALGFTGSVPGISFTIAGVTISLSGLAIAAIVGILLNALLPGKDYVFQEDAPKETGVDFSGTDTTMEGHGQSPE